MSTIDKTNIVPGYTIVLCGRCGYPRTVRQTNYGRCPFCRADKSEGDITFDAKVMDIKVLKESFFRSLQGSSLRDSRLGN